MYRSEVFLTYVFNIYNSPKSQAQLLASFYRGNNLPKITYLKRGVAKICPILCLLILST